MRANVKRKKDRQVSRSMWLGAMILAVVTAAGAGLLLAARQTTEERPETPAVRSEDAPPAKSATKPAPVAKKPTPAKAPTTVVAARPVEAAAGPEGAAPAKPAPAGTPVTVTGCLELDNQEYRLTDTEGANAPQSRSWKSGFLKKRAADLEVLDAGNTLRLATHLGQRVTITGVVADRKMQARSLVVASRSCN